MKRFILRLLAFFVLFFSQFNDVLYAQEMIYRTSMSAATVTDQVIDEACRYIGTPYRWGGKSPAGFDCAGFTRYVYAKFGISLASSAAPQYKVGTKVNKNELQKGDLVFYGGRNNLHSIGHVGIVTDVDLSSNRFSFIHASSTGVRITSSSDPYYSKRYIGACRVADRIVSTIPTASVNTQHASTPVYLACLNGGYIDPAIPIQIIVNQHSVDTVKPSPQQAQDSLITIAMVGDMMLGTTYPTKQLPANNGENLFDDVQDILIKADIAVGNCEGAICENGKCTKGTGKYSFAFRMPPSYAHLFKKAGFDFLSLANNHSNDFSAEGIRETMKMLDSMGIKYAGVSGMCESAILERDGVRYGFCAFGHNSYTYRHQNTDLVKDIIHRLRDSCDILIVSFHGGAEGKDKTHLPEGTETFLGENRGSLRSFAHLCIDEGADIVYGHGPHVCRSIESYKGHFIAYSLGNFCTPAGINVSGISGYAPVIEVRINRQGKVVDGKIHSFIQPFRTGPRKDNDDKVAKAIKALTYSDFKNPHLTIDDDGSFVPVD